MEDQQSTNIKINKSFSFPTQRIIRVLSYDDNIPLNKVVVGSYRYKDFRYPSDIDMREDIILCCSKTDAVRKLLNWFRKMIIEIMGNKGYYFSELKAGLDEAFRELYELVKLAASGELSLFDLISELDELWEKNYLTPNEYEKIMSAVNLGDVSEAFDLIRNKYILRWSSVDIMQGFKNLRPYRVKSLENALLDETEYIKVDLFVPFEGRYIESSNFIVLFYEDRGVIKPISLPPEQTYLEILKDDFRKFMSEEHYKPFKALKRLVIIARLEGNLTLYRELVKLFNLPINLAYLVSTDIETILVMLDKINNPPINYFYREIDGFRDRLANVDVNINEEKIDDLITELLRYNDIEITKRNLKRIKDIIDSELTAFAENYYKLLKN